MWGEGADYTPFSKTLNVVVDIKVQKDIEPHEHETCARLVGLKSAEYLGYALENVECDKSLKFKILKQKQRDLKIYQESYMHK